MYHSDIIEIPLQIFICGFDPDRPELDFVVGGGDDYVEITELTDKVFETELTDEVVES
jgi:hypothetical protein